MPPKPNPFRSIGGITPCPGGWLLFPGRLAGVTVVAEDAFVLPTLAEVLDYRPRFEFAAINVPFAFPDQPGDGFRQCDHDARDLVGWPRRVAVRPVPSRAALFAATREEALAIEPWLTHNDFRHFRWLREAATEIHPFHGRSFFSANAALSFTQMNGDQPLPSSPHHEVGLLERLELIRRSLPGVDEFATRTPPAGSAQIHMLEAAALLWTARRASARAISRLPLDPIWDEGGIRVEYVR